MATDPHPCCRRFTWLDRRGRRSATLPPPPPPPRRRHPPTAAATPPPPPLHLDGPPATPLTGCGPLAGCFLAHPLWPPGGRGAWLGGRACPAFRAGPLPFGLLIGSPAALVTFRVAPGRVTRPQRSARLNVAWPPVGSPPLARRRGRPPSVWPAGPPLLASGCGRPPSGSPAGSPPLARRRGLPQSGSLVGFPGPELADFVARRPAGRLAPHPSGPLPIWPISMSLGGGSNPIDDSFEVDGIAVHFVDASTLLHSHRLRPNVTSGSAPGAPPSLLAREPTAEAYHIDAEDLLEARYDVSAPVRLPDWIEADNVPELPESSSCGDSGDESVYRSDGRASTGVDEGCIASNNVKRINKKRGFQRAGSGHMRGSGLNVRAAMQEILLILFFRQVDGALGLREANDPRSAHLLDQCTKSILLQRKRY